MMRKAYIVMRTSLRRRRQACYFANVLVAVLTAAGCQQEMADQPSYKPLVPSEFFDDGLSARPLVHGTVARGHLRIDSALYQGLSESATTELEEAGAAKNAEGDRNQGAETQPAVASESEKTAKGFNEERNFVKDFPIPISESVIRHGQNRYMIYCVVCHDAAGTGHGKIVERGYTKPPSYHIERLRQAPVGRLFAVVSEGYGSMPTYAAQIPPEDRWAIVAYVRALQLSQHFPQDALTPKMRRELDAALASDGNKDQPPGSSQESMR